MEQHLGNDKRHNESLEQIGEKQKELISQAEEQEFVQTAEQIRALYIKAYEKEPFVRFPQKRLPEVAAVSGTNYAEIGVQLGTDSAEPGMRVVACFSATDNLIKGGAGQAIQSMNIMLGVDERTSLEDPGGWP